MRVTRKWVSKSWNDVERGVLMALWQHPTWCAGGSLRHVG